MSEQLKYARSSDSVLNYDNINEDIDKLFDTIRGYSACEVMRMYRRCLKLLQSCTVQLRYDASQYVALAVITIELGEFVCICSKDKVKRKFMLPKKKAVRKYLKRKKPDTKRRVKVVFAYPGKYSEVSYKLDVRKNKFVLKSKVGKRNYMMLSKLL